jgi:DNA polymerase-3 subunit epsilon
MRKGSAVAGVGFAVVDLETTGLYAGGTDRVVELGVVLLDPTGAPQDQWSTLVNPGRGVGPTDRHLISAREVLEAPTFAQVAGDLAAKLAGRVFVAHNVTFDSRFLLAEYGRLGAQIPLTQDSCICTMAAARSFLPDAERDLSACCRAAGVTQVAHHDALADALAAAGLLSYYLAQSAGQKYWDEVLTTAAAHPWPAIPALGTPVFRRAEARQRAQSHFLARLVERLPRVQSPQLDEYFALLDAVMLDRYLAESEANALVALAGELQLDQVEARTAHQQYLTGLAQAAKQDGIVTTAEAEDLAAVAVLLGLPEDAVEQALAEADTFASPAAPAANSFTLSAGDLVVLTGSMARPREWWETQAVAAGLRVQPNVSKKTRLVVAADPDSQSGKAAKARIYGIPIITEEAFGRLLSMR